MPFRRRCCCCLACVRSCTWGEFIDAWNDVCTNPFLITHQCNVTWVLCVARSLRAPQSNGHLNVNEADDTERYEILYLFVNQAAQQFDRAKDGNMCDKLRDIEIEKAKMTTISELCKSKRTNTRHQVLRVEYDWVQMKGDGKCLLHALGKAN